MDQPGQTAAADRARRRAFLQALPKGELHLHLEGAVPWEMTRRHSPGPLPDQPPSWHPAFRFADFAIDFAAAMATAFRSVLTSPERYHQAASAILAGLAEQNVRYAEISFSANYAFGLGLPLDEVAEAIRGAAPAGMAVAIYSGVARERTYALGEPIAEALLGARALDGIDLHGDERRAGAGLFADLFAAARARGLATRAHAGELVGPESVAAALDSLGVRRIEHGATAARDAALVARLAAEGVTLDLCPTSNLKLGVVPSLAAHPLRALAERGVAVTVSTDDPAVFGCTLTGELEVLIDHLGLGLADVARLQANAFRAARLPEGRRAELLAEVERLIATVE